MKNPRRTAGATGFIIGIVLGCLPLTPLSGPGFVLYAAGFIAVGFLLVRRSEEPYARMLPATEAARITAIGGLAAGVTAHFTTVVLTLIGLFPQRPDAEIFAFQEQWGVDYFTVVALGTVFGGAVLASIGGVLTVWLTDDQPSTT